MKPKLQKKNLHDMKNFKIVIALVVLFTCYSTYAQDSEIQKKYIPTDPKTNCQLRYSYFPNLYAYFDNLKNLYYYQINGQWESAAELPQNYGGYSIYNKARVAITNYEEENPEQFIKIHKKLYPYNSKGRYTNSTVSTE